MTQPAARRVFAITFVALMLTQLAWILALPAFHGIDEFDHVFKAEAVAHGQWLPPARQAPHGRGGLVRVPLDVPRAASRVCASYRYTGPENCHPSQASRGMATIATAASSYDPVWYAVMGTAARPFHGQAADYAMRVVTALACALLLAWAATLVARWGRDRWPLAAFALAVTPVITYSGAVAAPNGPEYAAALLTWAAGLSLARSRTAERAMLPLVVGAGLMCVCHSTGPVWLLVTLLTIALLAPVSHWVTLVRTRPRASLASVVAVAASALGSVGYVVSAHTNVPDGTGRPFDFDTGMVLIQTVLWPFQAVAAFPMRDESAPPVVYALWLIPLIALLVLATKHGPVRTRLAALALLAVTVVVPLLATMATYSAIGTAWQGRYTLPLYVGLPLLAGWTLTGRRPLPAATARITLGMLAIATAVSVAHVARDIVIHRPGVSAAELVAHGWLAVATLAGVGALGPLLLWRSRAAQETAPETTWGTAQQATAPDTGAQDPAEAALGPVPGLSW